MPTKKPKTFGFTVMVSPHNFKVIDENDAVIFNCPSEMVRGVMNFVCKLIDEDVPAILIDTNASLNNYHMKFELHEIQCTEMIQVDED